MRTDEQTNRLSDARKESDDTVGRSKRTLSGFAIWRGRPAARRGAAGTRQRKSREKGNIMKALTD